MLDDKPFSVSLDQQQISALLRIVDEMIQKSPNNSTALLWRSSLYSALFRDNDALLDAQRAFDIDPCETASLFLCLNTLIALDLEADLKTRRELVRNAYKSLMRLTDESSSDMKKIRSFVFLEHLGEIGVIGGELERDLFTRYNIKLTDDEFNETATLSDGAQLVQPHAKLKLLQCFIEEIEREYTPKTANRTVLAYLGLAYYYKAHLYTLLGNTSQADQEIKNLMMVYEYLPKALSCLSDIISRTQEYETAKKQCEDLGVTCSDRHFYLLWQGELNYAYGNYELALNDLNQALLEKKHDAQTYGTRALVYDKLGRDDDFRRDFARFWLLSEEEAKEPKAAEDIPPPWKK
ncbi:MAG: tetratricopeptide repeat protein [Thermoguttaceae bacterium]